MNEMEVTNAGNEAAVAGVSEEPQKVEVVVADAGGGMAQLESEGLEKLTPKQQMVMGWLRMGEGPAEAARLAGVARGSIYRWKDKEPLFRVFYNQWVTERREECEARMPAMLSKAMETLEKAMERGNVRAAEIVLKANGMVKPMEAGSTDLEEVEWDMALEVERKMKRMLEMERRAKGQ